MIRSLIWNAYLWCANVLDGSKYNAVTEEVNNTLFTMLLASVNHRLHHKNIVDRNFSRTDDQFFGSFMMFSMTRKEVNRCVHVYCLVKSSQKFELWSRIRWLIVRQNSWRYQQMAGHNCRSFKGSRQHGCANLGLLNPTNWLVKNGADRFLAGISIWWHKAL